MKLNQNLFPKRTRVTMNGAEWIDSKAKKLNLTQALDFIQQKMKQKYQRKERQAFTITDLIFHIFNHGLQQIPMHLSKFIYRFCRAQTYVQKFAKLEQQVNSQEQQYFTKQKKIQKLFELSIQTSSDKLNKIICLVLNKTYQPSAILKEMQHLKQLKVKLEALQQEQNKRCEIAKRLNTEEKQQRQKIFLADLAKFSNQFKNVTQRYGFNSMIKEGLTLSHNNLQKILQKSNVKFIGEVNQDFNHSQHQVLEGSGLKVDKIIQRGIKIKEQIIQKSKVTLKKQ